MSVVDFYKAVVQCALPPEFEALRLAFKAQAVVRETVNDTEFEFFVSPDGIVCLRSGMGEEHAEKAAQFAISKWHPRFYIDFGVAGALAVGLVVGDVVIAEEVSDVRGFQHEASMGIFGEIPAYPDFKIFERHRISRGKITCENMDVIFDDQRRGVYAQTGAIAVDWESAAVARVCSRNKAEFHSFRMISHVNEDDVKRSRSPEMLRKIHSSAEILAAALV